MNLANRYVHDASACQKFLRPYCANAQRARRSRHNIGFKSAWDGPVQVSLRPWLASRSSSSLAYMSSAEPSFAASVQQSMRPHRIPGPTPQPSTILSRNKASSASTEEPRVGKEEDRTCKSR